MTPPVIVEPPKAEPTRTRSSRVGPRRVRADKRATVIRCDIAAQQEATSKLRALGLKADEDGQGLRRPRRRRAPVLDRGRRLRCPRTGTSSFRTISSTCRCARRRCRQTHASRAVSTGSRFASRSSPKASPSRRTSSRAASPRARRYVRLQDGSFAKLDPEKVKAVLLVRPRSSRRAAGRAASSRSRRPGASRSSSSRSAGRTSPTARRISSRSLQNVDEIKVIKKPRNLKAQLRPYQEQGFQWLHVPPRDRVGRHPRRRHGSR